MLAALDGEADRAAQFVERRDVEPRRGREVDRAGEAGRADALVEDALDAGAQGSVERGMAAQDEVEALRADEAVELQHAEPRQLEFEDEARVVLARRPPPALAAPLEIKPNGTHRRALAEGQEKDLPCAG